MSSIGDVPPSLTTPLDLTQLSDTEIEKKAEKYADYSKFSKDHIESYLKLLRAGDIELTQTHLDRLLAGKPILTPSNVDFDSLRGTFITMQKEATSGKTNTWFAGHHLVSFAINMTEMTMVLRDMRSMEAEMSAVMTVHMMALAKSLGALQKAISQAEAWKHIANAVAAGTALIGAVVSASLTAKAARTSKRYKMGEKHATDKLAKSKENPKVEKKRTDLLNKKALSKYGKYYDNKDKNKRISDKQKAKLDKTIDHDAIQKQAQKDAHAEYKVEAKETLRTDGGLTKEEADVKIDKVTIDKKAKDMAAKETRTEIGVRINKERTTNNKKALVGKELNKKIDKEVWNKYVPSGKQGDIENTLTQQMNTYAMLSNTVFTKAGEIGSGSVSASMELLIGRDKEALQILEQVKDALRSLKQKMDEDFSGQSQEIDKLLQALSQAFSSDMQAHRLQA